MIIGRRGFLAGLGALMAAPAIVSVANIMPVKAMPSQDVLLELIAKRMAEAERIMYRSLSEMLYGDDAVTPPNFGLSKLVPSTEDGPIYLRGGFESSYRWRPQLIGVVTA
jgi:hypothetical protein